MKIKLGVVLIAFGLLLIFSAGMNAGKAPNVSYLVGSFLPGILFLILGLTLKGRNETDVSENPRDVPMSKADAASAERSRDDAASLSSRANMGIIGGIILMFLGSGIGQQGRELFLVSLVVVLGGWTFLIWGCTNYMRWKGYSGWFGFFGLLLLPGLIVLVLFPNRRKRRSRPNMEDPVP